MTLSELTRKFVPFHETQEVEPVAWLAASSGQLSGSRNAGHQCLLDVRSPGEFAMGHVPGAMNAPVLTDSERHEVGLTFKQQGQSAAIDLGIELTWGSRFERARSWLGDVGQWRIPTFESTLTPPSRKPVESGPPAQVTVMCWRGGMRSMVAASWLQEAIHELGLPTRVVRIRGGYKALRRVFIDAIAEPREYVILAGMTGCGKTKLLRSLQSSQGFDARRIVDLEALAGHRGSSFGYLINSLGGRQAQPRQQYFENALGRLLWSAPGGPVIVEDEAPLIGKISVPQPIREHLAAAPVVIVEETIENRVDAILDEYVRAPLGAGCPPRLLWARLRENIQALQKRLGGKATSEIVAKLDAAALRSDESMNDRGLKFGGHAEWITMLLERYYDHAYARSSRFSDRKILFSGSRLECQKFLMEHCRDT